MNATVQPDTIAPARDAATLIVIRDRDSAPKVLMGQRGKNASFFPSRFVFPGGRIDSEDAAIQLAAPLNETCHARLAQHDGDPDLTHALVAGVIRELWEETGQILGVPGVWNGTVPDAWADYAATGHVPSGAPLNYFFRAITPTTLPKRFDARFFLVDAADVCTDLDDFSRADDELSHLQWLTLKEARALDLPHITGVVLDDVAKTIAHKGPPETVRFFTNTTGVKEFATIA